MVVDTWIWLVYDFWELITVDEVNEDVLFFILLFCWFTIDGFWLIIGVVWGITGEAPTIGGVIILLLLLLILVLVDWTVPELLFPLSVKYW